MPAKASNESHVLHCSPLKRRLSLRPSSLTNEDAYQSVLPLQQAMASEAMANRPQEISPRQQLHATHSILEQSH